MPSCAALLCRNRKGPGIGKTFHRFPLSKTDQLKTWITNIGRKNWFPKRRSLLCSDHFEDKFFDRTGQNTRLRDGAVPTIFKFQPNHRKSPRTRRDIKQLKIDKLKKPALGPEDDDSSETQDIADQTCCALGCSNSSQRDDLRFFKFPDEIERRQVWIENMGQENWKPMPHSTLCQSHFDQSQFNQRRNTLKYNAVPTIFENVPNVKQEAILHVRSVNYDHSYNSRVSIMEHEEVASSPATSDSSGSRTEPQEVICSPATSDSSGSRTEPQEITCSPAVSDLSVSVNERTEPEEITCSPTITNLTASASEMCDYIIEVYQEMPPKPANTVSERPVFIDHMPSFPMHLSKSKQHPVTLQSGEELSDETSDPLVHFHNHNFSEKVIKLQRENWVLKKKNTALEHENQIFRSFMSGLFDKDQMAMFSKCWERVVPWTDETLDRSVEAMNVLGREGYTYLRQTLKLPFPSIATVQRYSQYSNANVL